MYWILIVRNVFIIFLNVTVGLTISHTFIHPPVT